MPADPNPTKALDERRRQKRLNFTQPIQFRDVLKANSLFYGSLSRDLSSGGAKICNYAPLAKGDRLLLLLDLPGSRQLVRAVSQVAWQSQRPFGSGYETGLQFIEIASEDRDLVASYVERGVVS